MHASNYRDESSPVVTALVGVVVAAVSAVFGISAHGIAVGPDATPPTPGQVLLVLAACTVVGAASAILARRRAPLVVAAGGMLTAQALVHLGMISGPGHSAAAHAPANHAHTTYAVSPLLPSHHGGIADMGALLTPEMLGAHFLAITATLAVITALTGALAWVAARITPLLGIVHLVVVDKLVHRSATLAPDTRYLIARGGTRAPPVSV